MPRSRLSAIIAALFALVAFGDCAGDSTSPVTLAGASLALSTLTSRAASLTADGVDTTTITVTPRDANGAVVILPVGAVRITANRGSLGSVVRNVDGTYSALLTAPVTAAIDSITGAVDGRLLRASLLLPLEPGPPSAARSSLGAYYPRLFANGKSTTDIYVIPRDAHGNGILTADVTMTTTKGTLAPVVGEGPFDYGDDGYYSAQLTSTTSDDSAIVSVQVSGQPFGSPIPVRFALHNVWAFESDMPLTRIAFGIGTINGILYAAGGDSFRPSAELDAYDPATDRWTAKTSMSAPRSELAVASANNLLYAVGGGELGAPSRTLEVYDPTANTWTTKSPMMTPRNDLAIGTANGLVYAVGGRDSQGHALSAVEKYDPALDQWSSVAPLPTARAYLGVAVVSGIVYAIGGSDSANASALNEAFNPSTGTWSERAPMPAGRTGMAVAVLGGKIYAMGGADGGGGPALDRVEVYDPATDHWTTEAPMLKTRYIAAAAEAGGRIYVAGGFNYDEGPDPLLLQSVEAYIP